MRSLLVSIILLVATAARAGDDGLPLKTSVQGGITLEQAMDQAEAHSFTAKIAGKTAEEAENRAGQTRGKLGPSVAVEAEDGWISSRVNKLAGQQILTTYVPDRIENAALVAKQPITGFAYLLYKLKAESLAAEASRHDADQSQAEARLAGADAYLRAIKAERLYEIASASLGLIDKQRNDAAALERSGKLSKVDVMRLDFALSEAKTQLIQARSAVDVATLSLSETLGLPSGGVVQLQASPTSHFEAMKLAVPDLGAAEGKAQNARSDLRSANKRIASAESQKTAEGLGYLPQIDAFTRFSRDFAAVPVEAPPIPGLLPNGVHYSTDDVRDNLVVGVEMNWVLWDWGSRSRKQGELAATIDKAREAEAALASKVQLEVAQAHAELRYSQEALNSSRSSLAFAEEVFRATELKFKNGLATTTDLIEAERDQTRARATLANAQGDVDLAWLRLRKAAGERVAL